MTKHYDVVILGGGLAGLALARQLTLETEKSVLLLEKLAKLPTHRQKVGESSVQVAGFYFSKVLDMEEYLFREHFMKYNLRFYWKSAGRSNEGFEDYSHSFIRPFSNVPSYQLNRNTFEAELLRRNLAEERFTLALSVKKLAVDLAEDADSGPHRIGYEEAGEAREVEATWVVDTTGRARTLAKKLDLRRKNDIRNASFWWWVDGLVDVDKLTGLTPREMRQRGGRAALGHLPFWLATNHFMDEGLWFWVIPLQGKTSLGIVYDPETTPHDDVFSVEKATKWVCERFPLFARDLPNRKVLDHGGFRSYSHDCEQTIHPARWAMAGEAGRFTDPLYSPGSDLISIYNTLIVDAIGSDDAEGLKRKCLVYEQLMRAVYQAYLPTYAISYDALGDQEVFSLKYTWELSIYFGFYVFPFINDFFTDRRFLAGFMRHFAQLGPMNHGMQRLLSGYFQWKKRHRMPPAEPLYFDFTEIGTLAEAEKTFYKVGVSVDEAKEVLVGQLRNLEEMARFVYVHVASVVTGDDRLVTNRAMIEAVDLRGLDFHPEEMRTLQARYADSTETYTWSFNPFVMERFRSRPLPAGPLPAGPLPAGPRSVEPCRAAAAAQEAGR